MRLLLPCYNLEEMLTIGHISDRFTRHHLHDSLKRERELSNRIAVLMTEKERRLKEIEKRVTLIHEGQELRAEKALRKEELERSLQGQRKVEQSNNRVAQSLRRDLSMGLSSRQAAVLQTKRSWYRQAKEQSQSNMTRIIRLKERDLQAKQSLSKRIKLMHLHGKENVKQYWRDRGAYIQQSRMKESLKNSVLFEHSLHNISVLEQKEQRLLRDIREAIEVEPNLTHIITEVENQPDLSGMPPIESP